MKVGDILYCHNDCFNDKNKKLFSSGKFYIICEMWEIKKTKWFTVGDGCIIQKDIGNVFCMPDANDNFKEANDTFKEKYYKNWFHNEQYLRKLKLEKLEK